MKSGSILDKAPLILFVLSLCGLSFGYGILVHRNEIFPFAFLRDAIAGAKELRLRVFGRPHTYWSRPTEHTTAIPTHLSDQTHAGLSLVTSIDTGSILTVKVIDMDGEVIHRWQPDWFEIWPDPDFLEEYDRPVTRPGTHIHGTELLDDGDLVFNFEARSLVRLDPCGEVVWRLPYRTHHSIYRDEFDRLWVPGQINHEEPVARLPNHMPMFIEQTIIVVSLDGEILEEISVMDLLYQNDLPGLLYMTTQRNATTKVSGDTLHLNDVEIFPSDREPGFFEAGDIMVSFRNIHAVLVFDGDTHKVKYSSIGEVVRQHDPDFLDADTISIFDNYLIGPGAQSRILVQNVVEGESRVHYTGTETEPFFTNIMGKHQWLPNGNVLITESRNGRAFEIDPAGEIVWEYVNIVDNGTRVGLVEEVQRLPGHFTETFFRERARACGNPAAS